MSCIAKDNELEEIHVVREWGVFIDGTFRDTHLFLQKKRTHKQAFWCTKILHGLVWENGCLDYGEILNILARDVKSKYFAKRTKKCKILGNSLD